MKFLNLAAIALLMSSGTVEATKVKTQAQMLAEIKAMSLSTNMQQVSAREKSLLKSMIEVDMNEYFQ